MSSSKYAHASIAEIEAAQDLSWSEVYEILHARAQRPDSRSARRAQAWCDAHPEYAPAEEGAAPERQHRTGPGSRGGDPLKAARALAADLTGAPKGSSEWWNAYKATRGESFEDVYALCVTIGELAD